MVNTISILEAYKNIIKSNTMFYYLDSSARDDSFFESDYEKSMLLNRFQGNYSDLKMKREEN